MHEPRPERTLDKGNLIDRVARVVRALCAHAGINDRIRLLIPRRSSIMSMREDTPPTTHRGPGVYISTLRALATRFCVYTRVRREACTREDPRKREREREREREQRRRQFADFFPRIVAGLPCVIDFLLAGILSGGFLQRQEWTINRS